MLIFSNVAIRYLLNLNEIMTASNRFTKINKPILLTVQGILSLMLDCEEVSIEQLEI